TVVKIDHKTGLVNLKTEMANLQLHFSPASLRDINEADTLTVQLGYTVTHHAPEKDAAKVASVRK
ncbi:MAG: hypothetical protein ACRERD_34200, partial [Candidatus Binatia bacterium]